MWLALLQLALFTPSFALDAPHINDRAGALSQPYHSALEEILDLHEKSTGEDFRLVIEKKVSLKSNDTLEKIYKNLKPGTYGKEDGAVILVSTQDEVVRIRLGHGMPQEIQPDDLGDKIEKNLFNRPKDVSFEAVLISNWIDVLDLLGSDLVKSGQAQAILEKHGIQIRKFQKPFPALRFLIAIVVLLSLAFLILLLQEVLAREVVFESRGTYKKAWNLRDTWIALFGSKKTETELAEGVFSGKW